MKERNRVERETEERYFVARQILHQLQYGLTDDGKQGKLAMMCWGVTALSPFPSALWFDVSGLIVTGQVRIELMPSDTYDVTIIPSIGKKICYSDVYCDDLVRMIDNAVERPQKRDNGTEDREEKEA